MSLKKKTDVKIRQFNLFKVACFQDRCKQKIDESTRKWENKQLTKISWVYRDKVNCFIIVQY